MEKVHIGTSGFYYDHWIGCCYPEGISKRELLPAYARTFPTVEINSTFYHFPRQSSLLHWLEVTPDDFQFSLKAHRSITHYHRLDSGDLRAFIHQIKPLRPKLGVILFQLPPSLKIDLPLLDAFLSELPRGYRCAVEFRNDSWLDDVVFELLALHNVSLCINDFDRKETPWIATAEHVYIRMHGPLGRYRGKYPAAALERLAQEMISLRESGKELYCYFNNDMEGFAWENARELEALIGEAGR
jgi:uncharacterized protein YecE (DUF72 family)